MKSSQLSTAVVLTLFLASGCRDSGEKVNDGAAGEPGTETMTTATTATSQPATGTGQTSTGATGGTTSVLSNEDRDFVITAAQGGLAEVSMGQIASQKATSADVKGFAQRMVTDHGTANQELTQLITNKGLAMPATPKEQSKEAADHLSATNGAEFDKMYMQHMAEDHQKTVADFEKASREAQDPEVKAWAAKTLPTLQQHLTLAQEIQRKLK